MSIKRRNEMVRKKRYRTIDVWSRPLEMSGYQPTRLTDDTRADRTSTNNNGNVKRPNQYAHLDSLKRAAAVATDRKPRNEG